MEASFKKHIDALLKLGVIRPSNSRHRTMAMIVNSGTTIHPTTGKETKGKERMVFNYKTLNDNKALQKELRDLSLCTAIPIPGYYKSGKRYGIRKSRSYKGKPHKTHIKVFKRKYKDDRGRIGKCKCYVCGREGHFARDCKSQTGNMARRAVIDNLDLKDDWDIVSADVSDQDTVYSISEGEGGATFLNIGAMVEESPVDENAFVLTQDDETCFMFHPEGQEDIHRRVQEAGSWRPNKELPEPSRNCEHNWQENGITNFTFCHFCGIATTDMSRIHCPKCKITSCAPYYLRKTVSAKRHKEAEIPEQKDFILKMYMQKDNEWKQAIRDQAQESAAWKLKEQELKTQLDNERQKAQKEKQALIDDLNEMLKITESMKAQISELQQENEYLQRKVQEQEDEGVNLSQMANALIEDEVQITMSS